MGGLTNFIQRWDFINDHAAAGAATPTGSFGAPVFPGGTTLPNHPEERLIVVDWITWVVKAGVADTNFELILKCSQDIAGTAGSNPPALTTQIWASFLTVTAGQSDTGHFNFQGGMPLVMPYRNTGTEAIYEANTLHNSIPSNINAYVFDCTSDVAADDNYIYIGYHTERMGMRG